MSLKHLWAFLGHSHFSCLHLAMTPIGFPAPLCAIIFPLGYHPASLRPHQLKALGGTNFQAQVSRVQLYHKDTLALSLIRTLYPHVVPHVIKAKHPLPGSLPPHQASLHPSETSDTLLASATVPAGREEQKDRWREAEGIYPPVYLNFSSKIKQPETRFCRQKPITCKFWQIICL